MLLVVPHEYLDLSLWAEFQESLANILDTSIVVYNSDGSALIPPSRENAVCALIKKQSVRGAELYQESYRKAIARALHKKEPYIYKCYTNQHVFVIPVILDSNVSVAIVGGHAYLSEDDFKEFVKKAPDMGFDEIIIHELEKIVKITPPQTFFTRPHVVKDIATPFLRSLYLKGFYEKRYYQMQSLIEITSPTLLCTGLEEIFTHVFNAMAVLFDVDTACVMERRDNHIYHTAAAFGHKKHILSDWNISDSFEIIKNVATLKRPEGLNRTSDIQKMGLEEGITSIDIFPMVVVDNVFGLFCIFNTKMTADAVRLLALLVNQFSFVLESMRTDQIVKKKVKGFDALEEIYNTLAAVLDEEELNTTILNKAAELVGAEQASLMLLRGNDKNLTVRASKGIDKSILENIKVKVGEGISGAVIEKGKPIIVRDIESESESFSRKNRARYKTRSFLSIPLKIASRTIGVINISDKITGEVFSEEDLHLLLSFASYASIALERGEYYRMSEELKKISITDSLTELFNRRYFQERLMEEMERSKRHDEPFTVFIIDIDDFKVFNDRYGHLAGDEVLKMVAHAIREGVRSIDVAARFGGEEFSIILPYTTKLNSYVTAERIRRSVEDIRFRGDKISAEHPLSVSIGVAEFPSDASSIEELVERADKAMYMAKTRGKNMIVGYEGEEQRPAL